VIIFLPAFGYLLLIMGASLFLLNNWDRVKEVGWGDKKIVVPLLVIVVSIGLSGLLNADGWQDKVAPLGMGLALFAVYLAARVLGRDIFIAFVPLVIIGAVSVIVSGLLHPGVPTGGFITNYCASAGYLVFGTLVVQGKWQWVLVSLVLVALFFVGALEGLFAITVLGVLVLARHDWSKRLLVPIGMVAVIFVGWVALGYIGPLWDKANVDIVVGWVTGEVEVSPETVDVATTNRWTNIVRRMNDIQLLGHGYWVTMPERPDGGVGYFEYNSPELEPVHNVPLVIIDQVGPAAGLAWLFVTIFCLVKTRWKYAWSAVIVLSVFDHYIWTQFAPYFWVIVGVSTSSDIKSDLIFKEV